MEVRRGETEKSVEAAYARAGFGSVGPRGVKPAVVVIDFSRGFTEAAFPTGSDLTDEVEAARRLLDEARSLGHPVYFTTIAYVPGDDLSLAWLRKAPGLAVLADGSELVDLDTDQEGDRGYVEGGTAVAKFHDKGGHSPPLLR